MSEKETAVVIVYGTERANKLIDEVFARTSVSWSGLVDSSSPELVIRNYRQQNLEMKKRGVRMRGITEITRKNMEYCKALMEFMELRHFDGVKGSCAVTEQDYLATTIDTPDPGRPVPEVVHSTAKPMIVLHQNLFDMLWDEAIPADVRIKELEEGVGPQRTQVFFGVEQVFKVIEKFFSNIQTSLSAYTDVAGPKFTIESYKDLILAMRDRGVRMRNITEITKDNIEYCEELQRLGVEVKHLDNVRGNYAISESEYVAASKLMQAQETPQAIYSNVTELVEQNQHLFETLWDAAMPAKQRIWQLVEGVEVGETRIIRDPAKARQDFYDSAKRCKEEVVLLFPTEKNLKRHFPFLTELASKAEREKISVRALVPFSNHEELANQFSPIQWKVVTQNKVGFVIYDRKKTIIAQYYDTESDTAEASFLSAIVSTNEQTILGIYSIFEALWHESELREREQLSKKKEQEARLEEERIRREAQLLQDILAHDIRNYNQVSKLSAEILKEELKENHDVQPILDTLLQSIDGSTVLVERAKRLGRILSEKNPPLHSVNLLETIKSSLALVRKAHPEKSVSSSLDFKGFDGAAQGDALVLADDFLPEVFTNLYSNSVRYTDGTDVVIDTAIEHEGGIQEQCGGEYMNNASSAFWRVRIVDRGRGIPDNVKSRVFSRYLQNASGSGLGMSIVYALVSERYRGKIALRDRVEGDHTKGTIVELRLPKAQAVTVPN